MTLCANFESNYVRKEARKKARRHWLACPSFERLCCDESDWRERGEEAIKAEMELRVRAWLLTAKER